MQILTQEYAKVMGEELAAVERGGIRQGVSAKVLYCCFTVALLLVSQQRCFTTALLQLYNYNFSTALLQLYYSFTTAYSTLMSE